MARLRKMFDIGDEAGYPIINDTGSDRKIKVIDRQVVYYKKTGKKYVRYLCEDLLERIAEDVRMNVEQEYDNLICIDGNEGSGKSNLAVALCKTIDPNWNIEENYIYNYNEFVEAITNGERDDRKRVFLLDEGSLVANKRESMSEDSKRFVEILETMRSRGWTLIMCIPSADRLDIYIREHRMRYLLTAQEMTWDYVYTTKSRGYFELQHRGGKGLERFRTVAYGVFPKMSDEDKKVYEKLKAQSQQRLMDKIAGKNKTANRTDKILTEQKTRIQNMTLKLKEMGLTDEQVAKVMGEDATVSTVKAYAMDGRKRLKKEAEQNAE